jgi:hypothetical protein
MVLQERNYDGGLNIMALIGQNTDNGSARMIVGHNPTPLVFGSEPESVTWPESVK